MPATARVFNIPPSAPFIPSLAAALVAGEIVPGFPAADDPLSVAAATIYLPTRRACRLARDAIFEALGTSAAVLPRILPLGDVDDDALAFAEAAAADGLEALDIPRALEPAERRFLLARLV